MVPSFPTYRYVGYLFAGRRLITDPVLFPAIEPFGRDGNHFASLVFITTLLGRHQGALLFGMVSDKLGQRKASILLGIWIRHRDIFDRATVGIQTLELDSYLLLVLLRFVDGILGR